MKDINISNISAKDIDKWIIIEAQRIIEYKLVLALNYDLFSPLTLIAATLIKPYGYDNLINSYDNLINIKNENDDKHSSSGSSSSDGSSGDNSHNNNNDENNPLNKYNKKVAMFRILLKRCKTKQWSYGPINLYFLNLDGIVMNYKVLDRYMISYQNYNSKDSNHNMKVKDIRRSSSPFLKYQLNVLNKKYTKMLPAIDWLCINETESAILIPEIIELIEKKWKLMAYSTFLSSFLLHFTLTIMLTLVVCMINSTSTISSTIIISLYSIEKTNNNNISDSYYLNIIMTILVFCISLSYFYIILQEIIFYLTIRRNFYNLRGIAKFDKYIRVIKISSFILFCFFQYLMVIEIYKRDENNDDYNNTGTYNSNNDYNGLPNSDINNKVIYHKYYEGMKISLSICTLSSWLHLYYYLMGFDSTGPLTLTIFKLVTTDIPHFFNFFIIVVIAFACSLGNLATTMGGNSKNPTYDFVFILRSLWSLIQVAVNFSPTQDVLNLQNNNFSSNYLWLYEFLLTCYYAVVLILMINLLIALMNSTYERYFTKSYALLLMAKYNIMKSMELSMGIYELNESNDKYSIADDVINQQFAFDENDNNDTNGQVTSNNNKGKVKTAQRKTYKFELKEHNNNWYYA